MPQDLDYQIAHFGIISKDIEKSSEWYKNNFGFQEIKRFDKPSLNLKGVLISLETFFLEIIQPYQYREEQEQEQETEEETTLSALLKTNHLALSVNNIQESYNQLKNNAQDLTEIIDSRFFFCKDIDGNLLEIRQK